MVALASGHDFFSSPKLSADGSRLSYLSWDFPQMPWDGTELWVAAVREDGTLKDGTLWVPVSWSPNICVCDGCRVGQVLVGQMCASRDAVKAVRCWPFCASV